MTATNINETPTLTSRELAIELTLMREHFILGFYDRDGIFFYEFDAVRPNEEYSYALAGTPRAYVLRTGGKEFDLTDCTYRAILKAARARA